MPPDELPPELPLDDPLLLPELLLDAPLELLLEPPELDELPPSSPLPPSGVPEVTPPHAQSATTATTAPSLRCMSDLTSATQQLGCRRPYPVLSHGSSAPDCAATHPSRTRVTR
jgi:hypothetical protein